MSKHNPTATGAGRSFSPVRTRRSFGRKVKEEKDCLRSDSSENEAKQPVNKRRRENAEHEDARELRSERPRTRSLTLEGEFNVNTRASLSRNDHADIKKQRKVVRSVQARGKGGAKKHPKTPEENASTSTAVRRSVRESRKVFDSLNERRLVHSLVGDYLQDRQSVRPSSRQQMLEEEDTDSQGEPPDSERPGYVSMYDIIKSKSKPEKDDEEEDDEEEEENGDEDDNDSSEDDEEEDDDDVTPQQRYKLRENKPVTKRYTAPPLKEYHNSRRGLFSGSASHLRARECSSKEPFSPVRKSYKLKRKTINESSTSTDDDDDDNRKFERRKAKSMAKARNRCLPMNLGLEDVSKGILGDRERIGSSLADVDPMNVDRSITFDSIGGLGKHVRSLKEMVVFPLLYPEIFQKFKVNPPRGVLFYGPPGTGKTLMARALANECSQDDKKVAFFMRKGADCLSKWVGESERQLRLLFDQAFKMRPSIIFFDEIDGLAPVRSSRQDQIHSSIVSTLLALMDGLDNRGEIVVIGATNRIDSIDPALRRPGRFDREFIFPLPDKNARRNILSIHTKDWQPKLTQTFINEVADRCVGYCGADIKALCTEATLFALRRRYPQIYASKKKLVLDVDSVRVNSRDFAKAIKTIVPACQRAVVSPGRALSATITPLLHDILRKSLEMVNDIFPPSVRKTVGESSPGSSMTNLAVTDSESSDDADDEDADIYEADPTSSEGARVARAARAARRAGLRGTGNLSHCFVENPMTSKLVYRPRYLVCGKQGMGQSTHLTPALLHSMEHLPVHCLDLPALFGCASKTPEEACAQIFREARRVAPSIIYLSRIESLWSTTTETLKATFLSLVNDLPPTMPLLLFATCDLPASELPYDLTFLFSTDSDQVFEVRHPTAKERWAYFEPLFLNEAVKLPSSSKKPKAKKPLEVLPVAAPPVPRQLNVSELQKVRDDEENTLRELRIFLREITVKLMSDRKFKEFYKPVDLEEVPDYLDVIKTPMDLSTVLQKVDGHHYQTCAEYLVDIDLITSNALEYNPNQDTFDRLLRHRACAMKDCAHSLIKSQLDVDFEKACQDIAESRKTRGDSRNVCAPKFFPVAPAQSVPSSHDPAVAGATTDNAPQTSGNAASATRVSRRVRGLDVDISLEFLPVKCLPGRTNQVTHSDTRGTQSSSGRKKSSSSAKPRSRSHYARRRRRKPPVAFRKTVATVCIPEPKHSGPEDNEETEASPSKDDEDMEEDGKDVEDNEVNEDTKGAEEEVHEDTKVVEDGQGSSVDGINEDEETMHMDEEKEDTPDNKGAQENTEDTVELKKSSPDLTSVKKVGEPDHCTNNYINSLHMRSEVQSALKCRLDHLNNEHIKSNHPTHHYYNGRESLSEHNFSMATSEVSNCDSKDVAELESMLSASPVPMNGPVAPHSDNNRTNDVTQSENPTVVEQQRNEAQGVSSTVVEERIRDEAPSDYHAATMTGDTGKDDLGEDTKSEVNSVEKSKRVLFVDDSDVHMVDDEERTEASVQNSEASQEDRGRFEGLLMSLVEATEYATIEKLERYHSRITQCIIQHKKDMSRQALLEDLKMLIERFKTLDSGE